MSKKESIMIAGMLAAEAEMLLRCADHISDPDLAAELYGIAEDELWQASDDALSAAAMLSDSMADESTLELLEAAYKAAQSAQAEICNPEAAAAITEAQTLLYTSGGLDMSNPDAAKLRPEGLRKACDAIAAALRALD